MAAIDASSAGAFVPSGSEKSTCFAVIRYTELLSCKQHPDPIPFSCVMNAGNVRGSSISVPEKHRAAVTSAAATKTKVLFIQSWTGGAPKLLQAPNYCSRIL